MLRAAGCCLQSEKEVSYWDDVYGFNMKALKKYSQFQSSDKPEIRTLNPDQLLNEPVLMAEFDLRWTTLDEITTVKSQGFASTLKSGCLNALAIWFDCEFKPMSDDWQTPVSLSTSPKAKETHWKQTVVIFPTEQQPNLEQDEVVGWRLYLEEGKENPRHYTIQVGLLDPESEEHPVPCRCQMAKCVLIQALLKKEEDLMT